MTVLFNNAGIGTGGPIQDMTDDEIDKMIAVNLTGVISGTPTGSVGQSTSFSITATAPVKPQQEPGNRAAI